MGDNNWDIGTVVRSFKINRPENIVPPRSCLESLNYENDDWNFLDRLLHFDMTNLNCFPEIFPMNFLVSLGKI